MYLSEAGLDVDVDGLIWWAISPAGFSRVLCVGLSVLWLVLWASVVWLGATTAISSDGLAIVCVRLCGLSGFDALLSPLLDFSLGITDRDYLINEYA